MDCYQRKYGMQTHLFIATQKFRFFHQNLSFTYQINYPFLQIPTSSTHPSKSSKITIQITHVQRLPLQHLHQSSTNQKQAIEQADASASATNLNRCNTNKSSPRTLRRCLSNWLLCALRIANRWGECAKNDANWKLFFLPSSKIIFIQPRGEFAFQMNWGKLMRV